MGSGSSQPTNTTSTVTQSNLPAYAQPYFTSMMGEAQGLANRPYTAYTDKPYDWATPGQRIAGFTDQQQQIQNNILNQQMPGQFQTGSQIATAAGLGGLNAGQYGANQFTSQQIGMPNLQQYSMQNPGNVQAMSQNAPMIGAAQTDYNPNLTNYQMRQPGNVQGSNVQSQDMQSAQTGYTPNLNYFQMQGPGSFGSTQAQQYMSPYMQNVVDVQKNEAVRDAQKGQLAQNLGAVRQGTYGGARQLLAQTENQRNLNTQLGNIQAQGQQQAFQNAQQQFNTEQGLQQQANQQNLAANLGVQNTGAQYNTQVALANLSNEQQARVTNQAQQFQAQGMNAQQALQAALANQQAGLTTGQQNLNANLQTQQLGANIGLQTSLANLSSAQQANVANQAAQLQQMGLNQQQALQAALANQQMGYNVGQQNLNAALQTQQLGTNAGMQALLANQQNNLATQQATEQSRQFGANLGLQGLGQANQAAQTLGNLGATQQQTQQNLYNQQQGAAAQTQALQQQLLDQKYNDFLRQQGFDQSQISWLSSILHGVPVQPNTTTTMQQPGPSLGAQLMGTGLAGLSAYNMLKGP
jgi:hypothetical protein